MSRARLIVLALVALLALPGTALGLSTVTVTGTVTQEGAPVAGVEVTLLVTGSDQIMSGTTDASGAFAIEVEADVDAELQLRATGPTTVSDPDEEGCVHHDTRVGRLTMALDSLEPAPVEIVLDETVADVVCTVVGSPDPGVTLPPTDAIGVADGRTTGTGVALGLSLAVLALLIGGTVTATRRRA